MNIFLTGRPGVGKSSVILKLIELAKKKGLKVAGFVTPEVRKGNERFGFLVRNIASGKEGFLASTRTIIGAPRVSKYYVDLKLFEEIAIDAIEREADIYLIDEVGKMELFSEKFGDSLIKILNSNKNVVSTLGIPFITQFKKYGEVIEVTPENRECLHLQILKLLNF